MLFLWHRLQSTAVPDPFRIRELRSEYAVSFYIPTTAPFSALHLGYVILRLSDHAISHALASDRFQLRHLPRLRHLAYSLTPNAVYGVLYYNRGLLHSYYAVLDRIRDHTNAELSLIYGVPITSWPADNNAIRSAEHIDMCYSATRYALILHHCHSVHTNSLTLDL